MQLPGFGDVDRGKGAEAGMAAGVGLGLGMEWEPGPRVGPGPAAWAEPWLEPRLGTDPRLQLGAE